MKAFPSRRLVPEQRTFSSESVEALAGRVAAAIADPELAWLFQNCLPNTLDTTIDFRDEDGPDTFVITGDIPAMWLRDSAAQVWPFLPLARGDEKLRAMLAGVVRRQARGILLDPYANAFYRDPVLGHWKDDLTEMRPGVHERKWELDSLAYFVRLSHGYWEATGDLRPFDETWRAAMSAMFALLEIEQGAGEQSRYSFERPGGTVLPCGGRGGPSAECGLIRCAFRPSDDMVAFPFLVPANAMMAVALRDAVPLLDVLGCGDLSRQASRLSADIFLALENHAVARHPVHGEIWAYEVDGLGGVNLMDDANVPSLLSLPYLGFCEKSDPRYLRTRGFCLSEDNPHFVSGPAGTGIGSPHTGPGTIWPMALTMQALTSTNDAEILSCLRQLVSTHAGTGFLHESFRAENADVFTRPWFSWVNTLFGELIVTVARERPYLLKEI
jgi:meiotically up-regulated gene 157 (Mug157) protein